MEREWSSRFARALRKTCLRGGTEPIFFREEESNYRVKAEEEEEEEEGIRQLQVRLEELD